MIDNSINSKWYSKDLVSKIITPNISTWRSRYDKKDQLLLKDNTIVIRNLRKEDMTPVIDTNSTQHIIEAKEQYRPDVVAYNVYGDARFAWIIMSANNIKDIFDFKTGLLITIPSITSLYRTGGVMSR